MPDISDRLLEVHGIFKGKNWDLYLADWNMNPAMMLKPGPVAELQAGRLYMPCPLVPDPTPEKVTAAMKAILSNPMTFSTCVILHIGGVAYPLVSPVRFGDDAAFMMRVDSKHGFRRHGPFEQTTFPTDSIPYERYVAGLNKLERLPDMF